MNDGDRIDLLLSPREVKLASHVTSKLSAGSWRVQSTYVNPDPADRTPITLQGRAAIVTPAALRLLDGHRGTLRKSLVLSGPLLALIDVNRTSDILELPDEVAGIVFLDDTLEQLKEIIALADGGYQVFPNKAVREMLGQKHRRQLIDNLPSLEREVLALVGRGRSNRDIAVALDIPETAVKSTVRATLRKLRFQNRTEAAVFLNRFAILLS